MATKNAAGRIQAFGILIGAAAVACIAGCAQNTAVRGDEAVAGPPLALESEFMGKAIQLTYRDDFLRAGEAYFDPTSNWIIFQAEATTDPNGEYAMYVAKLNRNGDAITGIEDPIRISTPGSANTCGWFHPTKPGVVLFGTTLAPATGEETAGYQRENSDYAWAFPNEMEICTRTVRAIVDDRVTDAAVRDELLARPDVDRPVPIFERPGYDAEGSWSPDGRSILYCHVEPGRNSGDLWVYIVETGEQRPLVTEIGYDGGPFFSPDGKSITYRSDRDENDLLQIFMSDLSFDADGLPNGIAREYALTNDGHVNWAPYFSRPDGDFIAYSSSTLGHFNYEVFAVPTVRPNGNDVPPTTRITDAAGFDGLSVFSPDGALMMWTAQRSADKDERGKASSQIWIAPVKMSELPGQIQSLPVERR